MENVHELNVGRKLEKATFAGGCFWCTEAAFKEIDGVVSVVSGYTGGFKENPRYEEVCSGLTGHYEAVQISFDPAKISYEELLDIFWKSIDPTDAMGQFVDKGSQYRTAIFYHDDDQKAIAEKSKQALQQSGEYDSPIVTSILPASTFFEAEEYHQCYYQKNPTRYRIYKRASGRG